MDLIERRPRSVFNARPVKDNVSSKLLETGRRLAGPKEMVRLLRLCVDHGEDKVLEAVSHIGTPGLSLEQVSAYLIPISNPVRTHPELDIPVTKPQFDKYDALVGEAIL